ncbi:MULTISPECIES: transcription/translation regulatory transformer protein RfaH [Halomonadaceae]|uniref:Transcription/translation regulatory transformer protein RfaH n=2 Tax=Vreelandella TaxID=3137766 RepID=A0A7Z0LTP0_9GAMM|nr:MULTISPECIES: transcription/translation regulatory transformer protein RfaH [Halomonas]NYS78399.1 transcription/translation regulatory transformer protein RfaH [Halomonas glaciei]|tara:strand:+ start:356 stop:874 length:519 start_codon:yes stop_codon:yes gene_type:complete
MDAVSNQQGAIACWYVIQCKGGESFRAAEHLTNQGYEVFHPVLTIQRKHQGRLKEVTQPLFPYYLFICLDQVVSNWRPIRSTRGVLRLLTFGDRPATIPSQLVETLRSQPHHLEGIHTYFRAGEEITINEGPFKDIEAVFTRCKGEERAIVLLNLLNRTQHLVLPIKSISKK